LHALFIVAKLVNQLLLVALTRPKHLVCFGLSHLRELAGPVFFEEEAFHSALHDGNFLI
jgi:hypothetical protein